MWTQLADLNPEAVSPCLYPCLQVKDLQEAFSAAMQQKASFEQRYSTTQRDLGEANGTIQSLNEENLLMTRQLGEARTGISNLRNRLDESETEAKQAKVQLSIQVGWQTLECAAEKEDRSLYHCIEHCGS